VPKGKPMYEYELHEPHRVRKVTVRHYENVLTSIEFHDSKNHCILKVGSKLYSD
jgi:hypothetical protein